MRRLMKCQTGLFKSIFSRNSISIKLSITSFTSMVTIKGGYSQWKWGGQCLTDGRFRYFMLRSPLGPGVFRSSGALS